MKDSWLIAGFGEAITTARILSKRNGLRYRVDRLKINGEYINSYYGDPYFKVFSY